MIANLTYGQKLEGKWILKNISIIIEFYKGSIIKYSKPNTSVNDSKYKIHSNEIIVDDIKYANFEMIKNNLKLFFNGSVNKKDSIIEHTYVKLYPTKTQFSIDEIKNMEFEYRETDKIFNKFKFTDDIKKSEILDIKDYHKMKIEIMDSILFISIYNQGNCNTYFPVEEVDYEQLKIYGVPNKEGKIIAKRLD